MSGKKGKKGKKRGSWMAGRARARAASAGASVEPGAVVHATDKTFRDLVEDAPVPVLVDFWADWCAPCKAVAPILVELAQQFSGLARVVKIDVEKHPKTPQRYGVQSIPTLLVFKDGEVLQTFIGATSKGELQKVIAWAMRLE